MLYEETEKKEIERVYVVFADCLVAPAFSSRKFFPAKRIGAHRSRIRS